jgi:hypothetical protein
MRLLVAIAVFAVMATGAHAQVRLDAHTIAFLEGAWCGKTNAGHPGYTFEFLRSGGTVIEDDGIDVSFRGTIESAIRDSGNIRLSVKFYEPQEPKKLQFRIKRDQLRWVALNGDLSLRRCGKVNRRPLSALGWPAIQRLSLQGVGQARFAEGASCGQAAKSFLRFDLIGPSYYSVWHYGNGVKDEILEVRDAREDNKTVVLFVGPHREELRVTWQDDQHILVQPWGTQFVRCG